MTIVFTLRLSAEKEKEFKANLKRLQRNGYPKVGDKITAIKSGDTMIQTSENGHTREEFHVTKNKTYEVIDNLDCLDGYLHVQADDYGCVRLTLQILEEFFGIEIKEPN